MIDWWPGDGNANDIVGSNDGTPVNGATFAAGLIGQAFSLDGVDDSVSFGNTIGNLGTADFTVDLFGRWHMAVQLENTEKLCRTMSNAKPQLSL